MGHAHDFDTSSSGFGRAFAVGIALNMSFVAAEALFGWRAGSLALLADAGHNLSDGALAWKAVQRLHSPVPVEGTTKMRVAGIGIAVNGITAALFMARKKEDPNIRGAFLHMLADALTSIGVGFAGALYVWRGSEAGIFRRK